MKRTSTYLLSLLAAFMLLTGCGKVVVSDTVVSTSKDLVVEPVTVVLNETNASKEQNFIIGNIEKDETNDIKLINIDTGSVDTTYTGNISCTLPHGFIKEDVGLYVPSNYPMDNSCISYVIADYIESDLSITEDDYKDALISSIKEDFDFDSTVEINTFKRYKISGCDALKIVTNYNINELSFEQYDCIVYDKIGSKTHIFTFVQNNGGKWSAEFEKSINGIDI